MEYHGQSFVVTLSYNHCRHSRCQRRAVQDSPMETASIVFSNALVCVLAKSEIEKRQLQADEQARMNHDGYAMNALFVHTVQRPKPEHCEFAQAHLPMDFPSSCLLRIGLNGAPKDDGFLDGDGLIDCITIPPWDCGKPPTHSSTYVRTRGRQLEEESRQTGMNHRFRGTLRHPPKGFKMIRDMIQNGIDFRTLIPQKDTCNTALAISALF